VRRAASLIVCLVALAVAGCGDSRGSAGTEPTGFDADRAFADLEAQVDIGPRPAGSAAAHRTAELIASRMRDAGLDGVAIQGPWENVVGTIPGSLPGTVVVGAHYDTKNAIPNFVGANDGASGVAVLLELARSLPPRLAGPSVQLVAFDAEEARGNREFDRDGTRGSRQFVAYARAGGSQGSPPLDQIRAMVLFDLVGDCDLQLPYEQNSDKDLYALFAVAAAELDGDPSPFEFNTFPVSDDHIPFLDAGIPAVDFIDFTFGPGAPPGEYWHTPEDKLDKVCPASLETVGETALRAIPRIR
jgi:Zn-dependent M28 family amino/carboxypeptidase